MSTSSSLLSIPLENRRGEPLRAFSLRMLSTTGGAGLNLLTGPLLFSSSTRTTIHTPTAPEAPRSGVQWIHRGRPSSVRSSRSAAGADNQRILAVTPRVPSARASARESRTRVEPPMRSRKRDCKIPGTRREGEVKRIRREGAGRRSMYCT
jgi:hypothetical protein